MGEQRTIGTILRGLRGSKSQEKIASELGITKSAWLCMSGMSGFPVMKSR